MGCLKICKVLLKMSWSDLAEDTVRQDMMMRIRILLHYQKSFDRYNSNDKGSAIKRKSLQIDWQRQLHKMQMCSPCMIVH